jgi:hypothetical protein
MHFTNMIFIDHLVYPCNNAKMIGAATLDRLSHGAYRVVLDGESYRAPKPMSERSKPPAGEGGKPA